MDVVHYFDIILHPKEKMPEELKKIDMNWAYKRYAIVGAILGLFIGIGFALLGSILGLVLGAAEQSNMIVGLVAGLGLLAVIIMPIVMALLFVVGSYIGYWVMFFIAKLLGGTGTFEANYFLGAKLMVPIILANIIIGFLGMLPILGGLVNLVWFFYSVYLSVVLVSVANKISMGRSVVVVLVPIIISIVLGMLFAVGTIMALMGLGAS